MTGIFVNMYQYFSYFYEHTLMSQRFSFDYIPQKLGLIPDNIQKYWVKPYNLNLSCQCKLDKKQNSSTSCKSKDSKSDFISLLSKFGGSFFTMFLLNSWLDCWPSHGQSGVQGRKFGCWLLQIIFIKILFIFQRCITAEADSKMPGFSE